MWSAMSELEKADAIQQLLMQDRRLREDGCLNTNTAATLPASQVG